jgi:nicotinamidase-related amidase
MSTIAWILVGLIGAFLVAGCAGSKENGQMLTLQTRSRVAEGGGDRVSERTVQWPANKTALIICDMWDDHWCKGAAARVVELAPRMNELVREARSRGVFVIHAPSSVVGFYDGTPQRNRAKQAAFAKTPVALSTADRWGTKWCWPDKMREPELPIDDSDMGCDCKDKCEIREAWKRQIASIEIHPDDAITDDGQEAFNLLAERGIDNVILMGVHLNMCVLGRPFAIRQMVHLGKNVVLVRDMTDTMYNSQMRPRVNHFAGTQLVVEHVERYWCPSVTSGDITGKGAFVFGEAGRLKNGE